MLGLSTSLNNFGSLKNIQMGAAAFSRRPPLYVFWLPKLFELLLKVSYFFLSIHFGMQGLSKITFWGPWTYSQINLLCELRNSACNFSKEKLIPEGFKSRFDTVER